MRELIDENAADVRLTHGDWWRSQHRCLRRVRGPVLAIWGAETIVEIAVIVLLIAH